MTQMKQLPLYSAQDVKRKTTRMPDFVRIVAFNLTFNVISEVIFRQIS